MLHDLSRQLRRLMKQAAPSSLGQPPSLLARNSIRLKNLTDVARARVPFERRNRLLVQRGALMHAISIERGDGCAIAILDQHGVVHAWHDSLPGATCFDFRIIGAHVSQFYLPGDVALLRPDRDLIAACTQGSHTQQVWHRRPGGSIFWAVTVIEPIYFEGSELNGYSHVTRFAQDPRGRAPAEAGDVSQRHSTFQGAIAAA